MLAEDQARPTEFSIPERALQVPVAPDDLADLVDCLIDNVFAHTPEQTPFAVSLAEEDGTVRLVVSDDGPGPAAEPVIGSGRPGWAWTSLVVRRPVRGRPHVRPRQEGGTTVEVTLPLASG